MRFIDLFAGLGGFHVALAKLGHECVFASELDPDLQEIYYKNHGIKPQGDIRKVKSSDIPAHDILCAGFPCQPFSKAGAQEGLDCPRWGDLFAHVIRIARAHKPQFLILENVPNLEKHDGGKTWLEMKARLQSLGYSLDQKKLSPHQFGIPQIRERIFIIGSLNGLAHFDWPAESENKKVSLKDMLDKNPKSARKMTPDLIRCVNVWQDFVEKFPKKVELPSHPIWSMEFGATYPFEKTTPHATGWKKLRRYKGNHGQSLSGESKSAVFGKLPAYAQSRRKKFPEWKIVFIRQNRAFYKKHKKLIDAWLPKILEFIPSNQKFEWNCKGGERDIWKYILQFRASGIRIKKPVSTPTLVAMNTTQVPVVGWEKRYITAKECAKLQCLDSLKHYPKIPSRAYKAFGNAVNAKVIELIARKLVVPKLSSKAQKIELLGQGRKWLTTSHQGSLVTA